MMNDPYLYKNTDILKNKLHIRSAETLNHAEADYTSMRLRELIEIPLNGDYDSAHLKKMHKYIFQDIYEWAGKYRTINIEKEEPVLGGLSIEYADYSSIPYDVDQCLELMRARDWDTMHQDDIVKQFCFDMASLWKIHPFREGNTRTVITFCCQFLDSRMIRINRKLFEQNSLYMRTALVAYNAVFHDIGDRSQKQHLERIVRDALSE